MHDFIDTSRMSYNGLTHLEVEPDSVFKSSTVGVFGSASATNVMFSRYMSPLNR